MVLLGIIFLSYLIGSIPSAYIMGRFRGIDIREHGSGNVGATNAFRVLGKKPALFVLLVDILKGSISMVLMSKLIQMNPNASSNLTLIQVQMIVSATTMLGHIFPVWLKFKGGKGMATGLGVLLGMTPLIVFSALALFLLVFSIFRIVSLSSITAAISLPFWFFVYRSFESESFLLYFLIGLAFFVTWKHKDNITRILKGKESRISIF